MARAKNQKQNHTNDLFINSPLRKLFQVAWDPLLENPTGSPSRSILRTLPGKYKQSAFSSQPLAISRPLA
jgi:hypothetical protein